MEMWFCSHAHGEKDYGRQREEYYMVPAWASYPSFIKDKRQNTFAEIIQGNKMNDPNNVLMDKSLR